MVRRLTECAPQAMIARTRILRKGVAEPVLTRRAKGAVAAYGRRAKNVLLHLESGWTVRIQLGMTGHVFWIPSRRELPSHTRVVFELAGGDAIAFQDARVFGSVETHPTAKLEESAFADYGPEPLAESFTWRDLAAAARRRKTEIKPFLLDQSRVVGLGNIWAAESLFRAGILPWRTVDSLANAEWQRLHRAIRTVLSTAIENTFRVTQSADEFPEADLLATAVYGRAGQPCRKCKGPIEREVQAGRATFYCGRCQK
jgi:formamidopyrimidine-DNA glycosylase